MASCCSCLMTSIINVISSSKISSGAGGRNVVRAEGGLLQQIQSLSYYGPGRGEHVYGLGRIALLRSRRDSNYGQIRKEGRVGRGATSLSVSRQAI
ncbi:hypothetical protein R1flu_020521 [Riccia fluitans]|uniref:Uncharacterized protein n=1 Tax=Riccia fluitans TaxID=41844 RepID=A0ABD1ZLR7_9MARC